MPADALLAGVLEAILFVADRPLTLDDLRAALEEDVSDGLLLAALEAIEQRHSGGVQGGRGFRLLRQAFTWQFRTEPEAAPWLRVFTGLQPVKLSRAALESLAIVAWRQPCTRADVERVRGVDSGGVLRALLERGLVRVAGRRDEPGRPNVYGTTDLFLKAFGLGTLTDLPSLRQFSDLGDEDFEAATALMDNDGLRGQVTFDEYAARRALSDLDEAADAHLEDRRTAAKQAAPAVDGETDT